MEGETDGEVEMGGERKGEKKRERERLSDFELASLSSEWKWR